MSGWPTLLAPMGVLPGLFERGASQAHGDTGHVRIGLAQHAVRQLLITVRSGQQVRDRHGHVVEVQLALVQPAQAQLVERLAAGDAGQVERHDGGDTRPHTALLVLVMAEERADLRRHRARDPRGLLAVDDDSVPTMRAVQLGLP